MQAYLFELDKDLADEYMDYIEFSSGLVPRGDYGFRYGGFVFKTKFLSKSSYEILFENRQEDIAIFRM